MRRMMAVFAILACVLSASAAYAIQVTVNGTPVNFDQPPVMAGDHVLVPLRGVFEQLGATVRYDAPTRGITAVSGATQISLQIGNRMANVNGQSRMLDSTPIEVGGRAMVPLRFVSEALGADVHWNESQQLVAITTSGGSQGSVVIPPVATYNPPAPVYNNTPLITSVRARESGPLSAGQVLHVNMFGASGGRAIFDVGGSAGIPMYEGPSGTYKGTYTVTQYDRTNATITGHLTMPDGRQSAMSSQQTVSLQGAFNNNNFGNNGYPYYNNNGQLINSVIHNGRGTLKFGQTLTVSMSGAPGGFATFDVGSHTGIPMTETSLGNYTGSFSLGLGDIQPNATVTAHLRMPDNRQASVVAAPSISLLGLP